MRRENTFRIDYSNLPLKPSYEKTYEFCRTVLELKREDVKRLQCHRGESCAFIKVGDLALAQKVVDEHDGKHEVECGGKKYKLRITMEDGSVEVRVWDLPENMSEERIVEFLSRYGEVLSIRELMFGDGHEYGGVPLGIWSARMVVERNIESWATIDGVRAYIAYKGQLQSCRHCHEQTHTGISCVQNKKLLVQKSYANVAKQSGPQQQQQRKPPAVKSTAPKPPKTKLSGPKATGPPSVTPNTFPELPPSNQNESSGSKTHTSSHPTAMVVLNPLGASKRPTGPPASSNTLPECDNTSLNSAELFKKPDGLPPRSKSSGNETDESTTSTSSRRNRGRQMNKKPRRDDEDDEEVEKNNQ